MGVVIGETAEVGENVTIYQGVTLGGTGFATGKRHPTVEDNVTIGSGAKLLGPITIGHGAKIGANAVVIHDVPPNSTVVGNPGHTVRVEGRKPEGPDADWVHLPDPIADAIKQLSRRIADLERERRPRRARRAGDRRGRAAAQRPRTEPRRLASATRSSVPKPPAEVFPWLLEEDKVPQWTSRLEAYEVLGDGAIGAGARIRQVLTVSGQQLDLVLEITRYDPPGFAESRFSTNGIDVVDLRAARVGRRHRVDPVAGGARASGFKARLLLPVVQPKLEKLAEDLERLRALLS